MAKPMNKKKPWKGLQGAERRAVLKSLCPSCGYQFDSYWHFLDCILGSRGDDSPYDDLEPGECSS